MIHKSSHQEDCTLEAHLNLFSTRPLTNEISIRERPWSSLPASPIITLSRSLSLHPPNLNSTLKQWNNRTEKERLFSVSVILKTCYSSHFKIEKSVATFLVNFLSFWELNRLLNNFLSYLSMYFATELVFNDYVIVSLIHAASIYFFNMIMY